jgi:hypothetical protein
VDVCIDTGNDYYRKDSVSIQGADGRNFTRWDACMLDGRVQEQMCCNCIDYSGCKNTCSKYLQCPNNCSDGACLTLPDLMVEDIMWTPSDPKPGDNVTFSANIKNIGSAPAGQFEVLVKAQAGGLLIGYGVANQGGLEASRQATITVQPPVEFTYGVDQAVAIVDNNFAVNESNEDNNQLVKPIVPPTTTTISGPAGGFFNMLGLSENGIMVITGLAVLIVIVIAYSLKGE